MQDRPVPLGPVCQTGSVPAGSRTPSEKSAKYRMNLMPVWLFGNVMTHHLGRCFIQAGGEPEVELVQ